jgi:hypothetical protein
MRSLAKDPSCLSPIRLMNSWLNWADGHQKLRNDWFVARKRDAATAHAVPATLEWPGQRRQRCHRRRVAFGP